MPSIGWDVVILICPVLAATLQFSYAQYWQRPCNSHIPSICIYDALYWLQRCNSPMPFIGRGVAILLCLVLAAPLQFTYAFYWLRRCNSPMPFIGCDVASHLCLVLAATLQFSYALYWLRRFSSHMSSIGCNVVIFICLLLAATLCWPGVAFKMKSNIYCRPSQHINLSF